MNIFEQMVFDNLINDNYAASSPLNRYPWIVMRPNEKLHCYVVDVTCSNCAKDLPMTAYKYDRGVFDFYCSCGIASRHIIYEPLWIE